LFPEPKGSPRHRTAASSPDNGAAYRSIAKALACRALGMRHLRTRARRPRTNGNACVSRSVGRPRWRRGSPRLSV